jgi:hypothetical protein
MERLVAGGHVGRDTLVWRKGLEKWMPAYTLRELFPTPEVPESPGSKLPSREKLDEYLVWSDRLIDGCLQWTRQTLSAALLESVLRSATVAGRFALFAAMFIAPTFVILIAVKADRLSMVFAAAGAVILLAIVQFTAQKLLPALDRLVYTTPGRMSSAAFLDCCAVMSMVLGIVYLVASIIAMLQVEVFSLLILGVAVFLLCQYVACLCLHPELLNICTDSDAAADEEAIGLLAFFFKLWVRAIPVLFGVGAVLGAIGLLVALLLLLRGGEHALMAIPLGMASGGMVVGAGLSPFLGYILFVFQYVVIGMMRSILIIPRLLEKPSKAD